MSGKRSCTSVGPAATMSQRRPRSTLCPPGGAAILPPARHSPTGCQNLQQHEHTHSLFEGASLYALLWNRFRSFDGLLHDLWDRHVNDLFRALRRSGARCAPVTVTIKCTMNTCQTLQRKERLQRRKAMN